MRYMIIYLTLLGGFGFGLIGQQSASAPIAITTPTATPILILSPRNIRRVGQFQLDSAHSMRATEPLSPLVKFYGDSIWMSENGNSI